ncbi:MAG: GNAT family N-acetyltransferase [Caldisericales bacterium]|nr:GNAT family N-acetyltransferase [Caldisericales bacterium]
MVLNLEKVGVKLAEGSKIMGDLEKIGFVAEAKMRKHAFVNGKYMDVVWMAIVRDDFKRCNDEL